MFLTRKMAVENECAEAPFIRTEKGTHELSRFWSVKVIQDMISKWRWRTRSTVSLSDEKVKK